MLALDTDPHRLAQKITLLVGLLRCLPAWSAQSLKGSDVLVRVSQLFVHDEEFYRHDEISTVLEKLLEFAASEVVVKPADAGLLER